MYVLFIIHITHFHAGIENLILRINKTIIDQFLTYIYSFLFKKKL